MSTDDKKRKEFFCSCPALESTTARRRRDRKNLNLNVFIYEVFNVSPSSPSYVKAK